MAGKKEWTRNRGKQPVGGSVWVEVRYRDGAIEQDVAGNYRWAHMGKDHPTGCVDIMAWRRVRAPRKPAAIAPEHAPRPAVPEAKPVPVTLDVSPSLLTNFDAPRREREDVGEFDRNVASIHRGRLLCKIAKAAAVIALVTGAVCYVF